MTKEGFVVRREVGGEGENTNKSNNIFGQHEIFLKGHFLYGGGI